jgi:uncharacterized membrane protein
MADKKQSKLPRDENKSRRWVGGLLIVFGGIGTLAAFILTYDLVQVLNAEISGETITLACSINAFLNCQSVMQTAQAEIFFGIPNSMLGLVTFPILATIGVALTVGFRPPKWFKLCMQLGAIGGAVFAGWMFYESLYILGILCPWCLAVDVAMIIIFGAITHYNLRENTFEFKQKTYNKILKFLNADGDKLIWAAIAVIMVMLIIGKFGMALFVV